VFAIIESTKEEGKRKIMVEIDIEEKTISLLVRNQVYFSIGVYRKDGKITVMICNKDWDRLKEEQRETFMKLDPRFYSG